MKPRQLLQAFGRKGRRSRYEHWVREYATTLYCFALRLCGDADTAEDLVQETFYHAWKNMDKLRHSDKARAWLFQTLRYRYAHWLRQRQRRPAIAVSIEGLPDHFEASDPSPLKVLADRESLQAALDTLHDRLKLPFLMVFLQGLTCQAAADQLDIPLGTVLSRIHRARRHLRDAMVRELDGPKRSSAEQPESSEPRLRLGGGP